MEELLNFKPEVGIKASLFIDEPKHAGMITQQEAEDLGAKLFTYTYGSEAIGEQATWYWAVNAEDDTILLARYTYFGPPTGIAAYDMLALLCNNKTVHAASLMTYNGLERFLRDNPTTPAIAPSDNYVVTLALDSVLEASNEYYGVALGREDLTQPCKDTPMSLSAIKRNITLHDIQTLQTLRDYTKAGSTDRSCHETLETLLQENKKVTEVKKETSAEVSDIPFRQMDSKERIIAVNKVIDGSVREFLVMDGGDVEILDVKENGENIDIYIRYLGACNGCASSSTGTLFAIEGALKEKLDDKIRVLPI
ncbi:MAG: Iron-sulfur cluster assembly scaffold protein IscU/NifU-like [uncultured Sulfurovum sp.]|uniref:Nitrogen fixation protein NifU n=1 Tax=uncultured Sulfurovum sp. TaxID=269237 RepID=A0A6S6U708_9BACT|nr:MAG: Iron-sulfur cluster assembly scaffold protein IscU/NifU-like [uncultured Sulfurovum sp.]